MFEYNEKIIYHISLFCLLIPLSKLTEVGESWQCPIMLLLDQLVTPLIIGLKDRGEFRISTRLETTGSIIIQMA